MNISVKFTNISILGAAGKMGSGITVLNTLHVSELMFAEENKDQHYVINAVDQSFEQLEILRYYVKAQIQSYAEKNINKLRSYYSEDDSLVENLEVVQQFVQDVLSTIRFTTTVETCFHSHLIFEAITENLEVKAQMLGLINRNSLVDPLFFTNTSSIPIRVIDERASLNGKIIGCHFYNPPVVQKLIEVIELNNGIIQLKEIVESLAKSQRKTLVPSNDIAGFIGNGVFIREIQYVLALLKELSADTSYSQAIVAIDSVTRELLLRPMGIFQLIDYVGIDVCSFITKVMDGYLDESLDASQLEDLLQKNVRGGQLSSGVQGDGFFRYNKGKISGVYDIISSEYPDINQIDAKTKNYLGQFNTKISWKQLSRDKNKNEKLSDHFRQLRVNDSIGAKLACNYLDSLKTIGNTLINTGVTNSEANVNNVMMLGFYQLYGPLNNY